MLKSAFTIIVYGAIFYGGFKTLSAGKRKLELILFVLLLGWCAYIQFAVLYDWQVMTPITLQSDMMEYISRWLQ